MDQTKLSPGPSPQPSRPRPGPGMVVGMLIGAGVVGMAWGITAAISAGGTFTLRGSMTLIEDSSVQKTGTSCHGTGGYSDITKGASVTVYDSASAVVASGRLVDSTPVFEGCRLNLEVPDVPSGEEFYQVEVSHRGKVTVSNEDAQDGAVELTLGN